MQRLPKLSTWNETLVVISLPLLNSLSFWLAVKKIIAFFTFMFMLFWKRIIWEFQNGFICQIWSRQSQDMLFQSLKLSPTFRTEIDYFWVNPITQNLLIMQNMKKYHYPRNSNFLCQNSKIGKTRAVVEGSLEA